MRVAGDQKFVVLCVRDIAGISSNRLLLLLFVQAGKQHKRKNFQKQPLTDVLQNSCSERFFLNTVKKTTVLESPFNKVAGLKDSNTVVFP